MNEGGLSSHTSGDLGPLQTRGPHCPSGAPLTLALLLLLTRKQKLCPVDAFPWEPGEEHIFGINQMVREEGLNISLPV